MSEVDVESAQSLCQFLDNLNGGPHHFGANSVARNGSNAVGFGHIGDECAISNDK